MKELLFSTKGRLNRSTYAYLSIILRLIVCSSIFNSSNTFISAILILVINLSLGWAIICVDTKRLHDMNLSWKYLFWHLVPLANFIFLIILLFKEGTYGYNSYGDDPIHLI